MRAVDLFFAEQASQLRPVLHVAIGPREDFFIERQDESVTGAGRGDIK